MAKSLKENGLKEILAFERRVLRQSGLGRIWKKDEKELLAHVNAIKKKLSEMYEEGSEAW